MSDNTFKSRDGRPVVFFFPSSMDEMTAALNGVLQPPTELHDQIHAIIDEEKPTTPVIFVAVNGYWEGCSIVTDEKLAKEMIARRRVDCEHCPVTDCARRRTPFVALYETVPTSVYAEGDSALGSIEIITIDLDDDSLGLPGLGNALLN